MSKKRIIILVCALIVLFAAVAFIIAYLVGRESGGNIYDDLQQTVDIPPVIQPPTDPPTKPTEEPTEKPTEPTEEPTEPPTEEPTEPYVSPIDFGPLWEINKDVCAWIHIPGVLDKNGGEVSYPVLQHPTDDSYYLNHTIEGWRTLPASIYSEKWNSKDFSDRVTILYGHNMANDTMFGALYKFRSLTYMREHQIISLYTPEAEFHYRIWAAVTYSNAYLPYVFDLKSESGVQKFINSIKNVHDLNSYVDNEVEISETDRFIVLSTCCPDNHYRLLVVAVLDEELSTQ